MKTMLLEISTKITPTQKKILNQNQMILKIIFIFFFVMNVEASVIIFLNIIFFIHESSMLFHTAIISRPIDYCIDFIIILKMKL